MIWFKMREIKTDFGAQQVFHYSSKTVFLIMCIYAHEWTCPWGSEEGIRSPAAECTGDCNKS